MTRRRSSRRRHRSPRLFRTRIAQNGCTLGFAGERIGLRGGIEVAIEPENEQNGDVGADRHPMPPRSALRRVISAMPARSMASFAESRQRRSRDVRMRSPRRATGAPAVAAEGQCA